MSKINTLLAQSDVNIGSIQPVTDTRQPTDLSQGSVLSTLEVWVSDIIGVITILASLFFIVYAFIAAFNWITAGGEKSKIENAQKKITNSIIGLDLLKPGEMIGKIIPT